MKICITSQGKDLNSQIDPRFGRCQYFIIVDPETSEYEAIENPSISAGSGAGIQSAQLIGNKGVEAILTGNVGPNAFQTLQAAGVKIIAGITGSVKEAIEKYKRGEIQPPVSGPSVGAHFGMQQEPATPPSQPTAPSQPTPPSQPGMTPGMGIGRGMGMGQGMGAGQGMGMGRGMGMGQGMGMGFQPPQMSKEQELQMLKNQMEMLKQQLEQITGRIEELGKE